MANLLGPSAFGAARAAATRPSVTPDSSGSDTFFQDCSSPLNRDGTEVRAGWLNAVTALFRGLIRAGAVTENNADDMLTRAVRSQRMNFVQASAVTGTANAISLAFSPTFASLSDLVGVPLVFLAEAANTGASTVAVDGLAATALTWPDGSALAAGDVSNGMLLVVRYDGAGFRMLQSLSPARVRSLIAANKSPFNLAQASSSTRTTYSSITGYQTVMSGTYMKQSATSLVDVRVVLNVLSNASWAAGLFRVVFNGVNGAKGIAVNMTAASNQTSPHLDDTFSGVGAGSISWSLQIGRDDANAWTSVWNPDSTNSSNLPASTTTTIKFQEREP